MVIVIVIIVAMVIVNIIILQYLLESQFDKNDKFKSAVNCELRPDDLRPEPIGSDIDGLIYWFQEVGWKSDHAISG